MGADENFKLFTIQGYLWGYSVVCSQGILIGIHNKDKEDRTPVQIYKYVFNENPRFYVREVDSFLETYPLCKRMELTGLLLQLVHVWDKDNPHLKDKYAPASYKEIGESCLDLK